MRMSTSAEPTSPATLSGAEPLIRVVSHSGLLYWWPVWLLGFILSGLTYLDGDRLAIVPEGTKVTAVGDKVYELTIPDRPGASLVQAGEATARGQDPFPVRVSPNRSYGLVYAVVILLVILGTNVPLRGLWSLVGILALLLLTLVLAYFDLWGWILERLWGLHIAISLAGYLAPAVVLLALWLVSVFGFDRLRYIRFTAGQFIVHKDIGDARQVYDTTRVTVQKRRSDLFRHWVLGLGSGDLIIQVPNQGQEILLPNVLFVDRRVQQIADLMKTRPVTTG
jgi:hypothetical protein